MRSQFKIIILFLLLSLMVCGQVPKAISFSSRDGFCSTTLLLDSLGNFYRERGCEGSSDISLGTYKLNGERAYFTFQRFDSLPPIYSLKESISSNDTVITVTILTRQGLPVANNYFSVDAIDTSGKFFQTIKLDNNGQIKVNFKKHRELQLNYLENIYRKKIRLLISNKNMTIILNLPQLFFDYPRPKPESGNAFSFIIKKDGLYDITGKKRKYSCDK